MPRNVELKARIESVDAVKPTPPRIADHGAIEIFQDDTFFQWRSGRLKLRTLSSAPGS
jgi:adenylate cyclase